MVDSTGSISGDRHEAMKERRLEAERVTLLARIQKEQDRLVDIQRQKDERRDQIMHRRTMRMQVESAAAGPIGGAEADDDDPPGTADPHAAQAGKKGAATAATSRRMQSPRRMAKKAPKFEEFTKKEKERLGIIKKQRCAVCRRAREPARGRVLSGCGEAPGEVGQGVRVGADQGPAVRCSDQAI